MHKPSRARQEKTAATESESRAALIRSHAARALNQITNSGRTIDWLLQNRAEWLVEPLAQELLYGTLRHYYSLSHSVSALLKKPLRQKDQDLMCLLLVGAYQLRMLNKPAHAIVHETVEACRLLRKPWAKGFINGVLRQLERDSAKQANLQTEQSFELPTWLAQKLARQYPQPGPHGLPEIHSANLQRAPMTLRVNLCQTSVTEWLQKLPDSKATAAHPFATTVPQAVVLANPCRVDTLPGWKTGEVAVQDLGAQAAGSIWQTFVQPILYTSARRQQPLRILDACAAPGGKLFHLLEILATNDICAEVVALESSPHRASQTRTAAEHLGHAVDLHVADATTLDWWSGEPFDHVLLDAPCSGTGTLRRHPDIKVLLQEAQIEQHAQTQLQLLNNLWRTVSAGGTLLYCTCSLLEEENDLVIDAFLADESARPGSPSKHDADAVKTTPGVAPQVLPLNLASGHKRRHGWQLSPTEPTTDGFYYALLHKPGSHQTAT